MAELMLGVASAGVASVGVAVADARIVIVSLDKKASEFRVSAGGVPRKTIRTGKPADYYTGVAAAVVGTDVHVIGVERNDGLHQARGLVVSVAQVPFAELIAPAPVDMLLLPKISVAGDATGNVFVNGVNIGGAVPNPANARVYAGTVVVVEGTDGATYVKFATDARGLVAAPWERLPW